MRSAQIPHEGVFTRLSIEEDIDAVGEIRDTIEELHIMLYITELQRTTLGKMEHRHRHVWEDELQTQKDQLDRLCSQSKDINEMVSSSRNIPIRILEVYSDYSFQLAVISNPWPQANTA